MIKSHVLADDNQHSLIERVEAILEAEIRCGSKIIAVTTSRSYAGGISIFEAVIFYQRELRGAA